MCYVSIVRGTGEPPRTRKATTMTTNATILATVPSSSNPLKSYDIRLGKDGNVYCTCPAWKYQKKHPHDRTCKHLKAFAKQVNLPKAG